MMDNDNTYVSPNMMIAETIKIKVGGSKHDFHNIGNYHKLMEEFMIQGDIKRMNNSGHCHWKIANRENQ